MIPKKSLTTQLPSVQHILKTLCSSNIPYYFPEEHKKNVKIGIFAHTAAQKGLEKNYPFHQQKYSYCGIMMPHIHKIPPSVTQKPL